ncbi:MAG TPA: response regulator [Albitalea sp.]|uniref:response regulator n=1 Tax=Piscinibacter sp. TaxID=1903157 RepID=UPI002ED6AAC2
MPLDDDLPASCPRAPVHTVLYVEDHPVNVVLMEALFRRRPGARLRVATSGEDGLRAALEERPDLLLLDLRLPDCRGNELLQRLRALPGLAEVPAVAVTAEDTGDLAAQGFAEVWHKPMDLGYTLVRLDRLLERPAPSAQARVRIHPALPTPIPFPLRMEQ